MQVIAQKPHPLGSAEHDKVAEYISNQLTSLGLTPQAQDTQSVSERNFTELSGVTYLSGAKIHNVMAQLKGTQSDKAVLSHGALHNSVPGGPGATDDGASVASILETARALKAGPALKNDVIFLFTDGEEFEVAGSRRVSKERPWAKDVGLVLNFDARGVDGPVFMFQTSDNNGWLIKEFCAGCPRCICKFSLLRSI